MPSLNWITATDLQQWANRRPAQEQLPRLLRRLIHATIQKPRKVGFPAGDSVQIGGWDGVVDAPEGNEFVPDGYSVWELGVNRDVKGKADSDYQKRSDNSLGLIPSTTTFVFVTLRRWTKKDDWVEENNNEKIWAEVRAYDADDLEQWLELAPAVHRWLAKLIGKWIDDALDIGTFWDEWRNSTCPAMTAQLHLAGREEQAKEIATWLNETPSNHKIYADSIEEAITFFAAAIEHLPDETRIEFLSRCIIAKNETAWRFFCNFSDPLILIPQFEHPQPLPKNHYIFLPLGREINPSQNSSKLPRSNRKDFREALIEMGVSEEKAYRLTKESKRNILVLRRLLAIASEIHEPDWSKPEHGRSLIPALLAGAWNDSLESDRNAISKLAQKPYQEVVDILVRWSNVSDPPIRKVGNIWQVLSREDSWRLLSQYISSDDLDRCKEVTLSILELADPKYELPLEQQWAANIYGKQLPHSNFLRQGLTETLAILSTRGLPYSDRDSISTRARIDIIVHQLLTVNADWIRWSSLSDLLPTLAEAAPEQFLEAVENDLTKVRPYLLELFTDTNPSYTSFCSGSPHTGLLWSLEVLAWNPKYLSRVSLALAKLSKLDPGGQLSNRPFSSLWEIFLCWYPKTKASLEKRLQIIELLLKKEPDIAWNLLCSLLPQSEGNISHTTCKPRWKDWGIDGIPKITGREYWNNLETIVEYLLSHVQTDCQRLCDLVESLESLIPEWRDRILNYLDCVDRTQLRDDELEKVWNRFRQVVYKHRKYSKARWAMPTEIVDRIYEIFHNFEPIDPIYRYAWAFSYEPKFLDCMDSDWKIQQEKIRRAQANMATQIYSQGELQLLLKIVECIEDSGSFGIAIAEIEISFDKTIELLRSILGKNNNKLKYLALGFVWKSADRFGNNWIKKIVTVAQKENWSSQMFVDFSLGLPFSNNIWNYLEQFNKETEKLYWKTCLPQWVNEGDLDIAIGHLLDSKRPHYALCLCGSWLHKRQTDELKKFTLLIHLLVKILDDIARTSFNSNTILPVPHNMISYYIEIAFCMLDDSKLIDENKIASLEWLYIETLKESSRRTPKFLHRELGRNPQFFVEMLKFIYQDDPSKSNKEKSKSLLRSWHQIPGIMEDGKINLNDLKEWVLKVIESCQKIGLDEEGKVKIGEVLAHSPFTPNGAWPDIAVCEIIEEIGSQTLENSIGIGIYNKRGVVTKSLDEGGLQERELAKTYENYAIAVEDIYPRTAAMLYRIAESYNRNAHREDIRFELMYS